MKEKLKKCLSIVLALTVVFGSAFVGINESDFSGAFAVETKAASVADLFFTLNDNGESYSVTNCNASASGEIVIPSSINNLPVTAIGYWAFNSCGDITSVVIPDSIESIDEEAFSFCEKLSSITIGENVTSIGEYAFSDTAYFGDEENWEDGVLYIGKYLISADGDALNSSYNIKDGTRVIADAAFSYCEELEEIIIPDSVVSIGNQAFSDCYSLGATAIPDSVVYIGDEAFFDCESFEILSLSSNLKNIGYGAFWGCSSLDSITLSDSVTGIGGAAFIDTAYYDNTENWEEGTLYIGNHLIKADSDALSGFYTVKDGTKTIAGSAFYGCEDLESVTIPGSVVGIGSYAFSGCKNLTTITIPDSVTSIEDGLFDECTALASIGMHNNITKIGMNAFNSCSSLETFVVPDNVMYIAHYAFRDCEKLSTIIIPDSITSIGESAFNGCTSLLTFELPDNITNIDRLAMLDTAYYNDEDNWENGVLYKDNYLIATNSDIISGSYSIKDGTKLIADEAFENCGKLTSISIPGSVFSVGESAFENCEQLISVVIGDGVKNVEECAFSECVSLASVTIGESVTNIADEAFWGCTSLNSIEIPAGVTVIGNMAFGYYFKSMGVCSTIDNFIIYGTVGTQAHIYAKENDFKFVDPNHTHTVSSWITDKKATVYKAGSKHKECTECGDVLEAAEIPQLKCSKPTLKSIENSEYGVLIKWGKVKGADRYRVYRKTSKSDWEYIGYTTNTYYTDKTAKSGTKYYYAVRARNEAGNSSLSSSLSRYYLADPTLKTISSSSKGIAIKWTKVTGAQGYMVYRKEAGGSYKRIATEKGVSNLAYRDTSAKKGRKYTYKIKAYYSKTYSAYSNTKTITDKY